MSFQKNMHIGWSMMFCYWSISALVGHFNGYFDKILSQTTEPSRPVFTHFHAIALLVTIISRIGLNPRYGRFGRRPDYLGILIFGIMNGIFETFMFLFAYDVGRHMLAEDILGWWTNSNPTACCLLGFATYYFYTGWIHVWFWDPKAFPQHLLPMAPYFPTHGLPYLIALSVSWLALYEQTKDVFFFCFCHVLEDLWMAWHCAIPFTQWNSKGGYVYATKESSGNWADE